MVSKSHDTILLLIAQNGHLPKVQSFFTHAPKFFSWLKQSIKVKVERGKGLSCLSLIFRSQHVEGICTLTWERGEAPGTHLR